MRAVPNTRQLSFLVKSKIPRIVPFSGGEEPPGFFIVGSGRSGSTLLRKHLMLHYKVFIPPETYVLGTIINEFANRPFMKWPDVVDLALSRIEGHPEFDAFAVTDLNELRKLLLSISRKKRTLECAISSFFDYLGHRSGVDYLRWGDKTPLNVFFLNEIERTFPSAQFVFLFRDGVDATVSYLKAGLYPTLESAARRWAAANESAWKFFHSRREKVIGVSYEQLVSDRSKTLATLANFLDLGKRQLPAKKEIERVMSDVNRYAHLKEVTKDVTQGFIGKGRRDLTTHELIKLAPILDEMLLKLNYEPCV